MEKWLTVKEAADLFGVTQQAIYRHINLNGIPTKKERRIVERTRQVVLVDSDILKNRIIKEKE